MPRRVGVLGGTFDPPHIGHLVTAAEVRHALGLDEVLLVVADTPWQKTRARRISQPEDRLAMVRAGVSGIDGLSASDVELQRGGESYSIDTLSDLGERFPGDEFLLIVGADAAAGLDTWHRADELCALAELVVVDRPGTPAGSVPARWRTTTVPVPQIDVSSTDLRARVASGRPIDFLVPPAVVEMIGTLGLYRDDE